MGGGMFLSRFIKPMPWNTSALHRLEQQLQTSFPKVQESYARSERVLGQLAEVLPDLPREVSFVVCGSLARKEFCEGSDLDWYLLVDGKADADHRELEKDVRKALARAGGGNLFKDPNPTGAFGALVFSHELIHCIGGSADTNANLTRRLLLLLESTEVSHENPLSPRKAVMRAILERYFGQQTMFGADRFFPRFLLNDIVRLWRTMAVDYAAKLNERGPRGWALRNTKLRFSRKLLFVAGLLLTYECDLFERRGQEETWEGTEQGLGDLEQSLDLLRLTPLEMLGRAALELRLPEVPVMNVFEAYGQFLAILDDGTQRTELEGLDYERAASDPLFQQVRAAGEKFQDGLHELFLNSSTRLGKLTMKYGVF